MSRFRPTYPAQILRELNLALPPSSYKPYYYDTIGNVSTSHFRPSRDGKIAKALLQVTPRYPVLGGWNYTFTVGWDMPLVGYLKNSAEGRARKVLSVPFLTGLKDVAVDEAEVSVILPEGARLVDR
jgi:oligosaccharyltransferase complex subunit alpha (ribophorin I)